MRHAILTLAGIHQIAGSLIGLFIIIGGVASSGLPQGGAFLLIAIMALLFAASVAAGIGLSLNRRWAWPASLACQLIQIPVFILGGVTWLFAAGTSYLFPLAGPLTVPQWQWGSRFQMALSTGFNEAPTPSLFAINVVALGVLVILLLAKPRTAITISPVA